jgi:hypothetical protein
MSNLYIQLKPIHSDNKSEGVLPDTAKAYIAIKCCSTINVENQEFKIISSECCSKREVEDAADLLIKELKTIKREANDFFHKEQEKKCKDTNKLDK